MTPTESPDLSISNASFIKDFWDDLKVSAQARAPAAGLAFDVLAHTVLDVPTLAEGLARNLARQSLDHQVPPEELETLISSVYDRAPDLVFAAATDLVAVVARDPAAADLLTPFLYFKGFIALQTHRVAHVLWKENRVDEALYLQNRSSVLYGVDIHPAARIGVGVMFDHATGIVIGETAVVGDNVSILHGVTLGGSGKARGDRHPKIGEGVMIGAGTSVLGNVKVGAGACLAAGSVVLADVPAHTTVAGVPAKIVGAPKADLPALEMEQNVI